MFNESEIDTIFNAAFSGGRHGGRPGGRRGGFARNLIGFDPVFRRLSELSSLDDFGSTYPPYNLERIDDTHYQLTLAVAGFNSSDIEITVENNELNISGKASTSKVDESKVFVHKGIAERNFNRKFILADYVQVSSADLNNGLLVINFVHEVPEALKPRKIPVGTQNVVTTIIDSSAKSV